MKWFKIPCISGHDSGNNDGLAIESRIEAFVPFAFQKFAVCAGHASPRRAGSAVLSSQLAAFSSVLLRAVRLNTRTGSCKPLRIQRATGMPPIAELGSSDFLDRPLLLHACSEHGAPSLGALESRRGT